jgi:hypothetical protein
MTEPKVIRHRRYQPEQPESPTTYTRIWQVVVGLCVVWILGFDIWGVFK